MNSRFRRKRKFSGAGHEDHFHNKRRRRDSDSWSNHDNFQSNQERGLNQNGRRGSSTQRARSPRGRRPGFQTNRGRYASQRGRYTGQNYNGHNARFRGNRGRSGLQYNDRKMHDDGMSRFLKKIKASSDTSAAQIACAIISEPRIVEKILTSRHSLQTFIPSLKLAISAPNTPHISMKLLEMIVQKDVINWCSIELKLALVISHTFDEQDSWYRLLVDLMDIIAKISNFSACTKDVLRSSIGHVTNVLNHIKFFIPDSNNSPIFNLLKEKDKELETLLQQKADEVSDKSGNEQTEYVKSKSIFPDMSDFKDDPPKLTPIKTKDGYENFREYMHIQYSLLREDFVGPLRDEIRRYCKETEKITSFNKHKYRYNDIRIYDQVRIVSLVFDQGVNYVVTFDTSTLRRIQWTTSGRLKYGTLVCLSPDNFQTMLVGVVCDSDPSARSKGFLHLKFDPSIDDQTIREAMQMTHTMIEAVNYFEAYKHVLLKCKQLSESDLAMLRYIIHCEKLVLLPTYLRKFPKPTFDLRSLADPNFKVKGINRFEPYMKDDEPENSYVHPRKKLGSEQKVYSSNSDQLSETELQDDQVSLAESAESMDELSLEKVNIVDDEIPEAALRRFDSSQMAAVRNALKDEISIIQGPPGCGKTFVGKEIIKVLLNNQGNWRQGVGGCEPILVLCYTNHALDQFMEGICEFYSGGVLRVGGRSRSEKLKSRNLSNLRSNMRKARSIPDYIYNGRKSERGIMHSLRNERKLVTLQIQCLRENIIHEHSLYEEMGPDIAKQFEWKRNQGSVFIAGINCLFRSTSMIYDWLCIEEISRDVDYFIQQNGIEQIIAMDSQQQHRDESDEFPDLLTDRYHAFSVEDFKFNDNDYINDKLNDFAHRNVALKVADIERKPENVTHQHWDILRWTRLELSKRIRDFLRRPSEIKQDPGPGLNIYHLNRQERWDLYNYWVNKKCSKLAGEIENNMSDYKSTHGRYEEVLMLENEYIMRMADVIGMTTTCAAKHSAELQSVNPSIIIVEEAAEIFESHLVTNISKGCQQLILIGDHKQLRPKPNNYKIEKGFNFDVSLFERLIMSGIKYTTLSQQHRMRPLIAENVRKIYPHVFDHPDVKCYDHVKGMEHNMVFLKHCHNESADGSDSKSHRNPFEAAFSIRLARYLVQQGYSPDEVTILTTYKGQMFDIMRLKRNEELLQGMTVTVVDNFQGEESDIVILSLVRSNAQGKIGFLSKDNRVCVALSRAKIGLYVLGNFDMYNTKLWTSIITSPLTQSLILPAIPLQCQNHPNVEPTLVSTADDFDKVPGGGCTRPCEFDMACGHRCYKSCHLEDKEHEKVKCIMPCERKCTFGHPCKLLCGDECKCTEKIEITPPCGHNAIIPCFKQTDYKCQEICGKQLPCGHNCRKVCHKPCGSCTERVTVILPGCGHSLEACCHEDISEIKCMETCNCPLDCGHICREVCGKGQTTIDNVSSHSKCIAGHLTVCNEKCNMKLACGDICSGTCYDCFQGRLHKPCQRKCQHKLICNHPCNGTCNSCVPCQLQCDRFCPHRRCTKKCYEICQICMEPCTWTCKHYTCTKPCGEPCDRPKCNRRCPEVLYCGHKCIGLCGEPCLRFCPTCRRKEFEENCFGGKQFPASSFVQLDDCGHAVQYKLLDEYFDDCSETTLRQCPICSTPIYHCRRYGAVLKRMLKHIDKMKSKLVNRTWFCNFVSGFDLEKEFTDYLESLNERNVEVLRHFIESSNSRIDCILENLRSSEATPSLQWRTDITNEVYRACDHATIDRIEQEIAEKLEATKQMSTVRALILSRKPYTNTTRQRMVELTRNIYRKYEKRFELVIITLEVQGINNKNGFLTYGYSQGSESSVELVPYEDQSNSPGTSILNDLFAVDDSSEEYQFVAKIQHRENCDVANDFGHAVDTNENTVEEAHNLELDDTIPMTVRDVHSLSMDEEALQIDPIQNVADNDTPTDGQTIDSTLQNEKIKELTVRSTDRWKVDLRQTYGTKTESKFETEKSGHKDLTVVNEIVSDEVLVTEDECEQRKISAQESETNALATTKKDIRYTDNSKDAVSADDLTLAAENGSEEIQTSPREFDRDLAFGLALENKQEELKKSPREFERAMTLIWSSGNVSEEIKTSPKEVEKNITLASVAENGSEEMQTSPKEVGKDTSLLERQSTTSVKLDDSLDASSRKVDVFALPKKLVMYTTPCPEYYKCEKMAVPEEFKRIVRSMSHNVKESRKSEPKSSRDDGPSQYKNRYKPRETGSERPGSSKSRKRDVDSNRYMVTENSRRKSHGKNYLSESRRNDLHKDNDIDNFENHRRHSSRNLDRRSVTENKNKYGDRRYNSSRGGIYRDTDRITDDRNRRTNKGHNHTQSNHKHSDRETVTEKQSGHAYSDSRHIIEKKRRHNDSDRESSMKNQSGYKYSDRCNAKEEENIHKDSDRESCTKKQRRHKDSERRDGKEERSRYKYAGRSSGKEKRHMHKDLKRSIERENQSRNTNSSERGREENKRSRPKHWERICDVEEQGRQESLGGINLSETKNTEADSDRSVIIENQNIDIIKDGIDPNDTLISRESKTTFESQIEDAPNEDTNHKMVKKTDSGFIYEKITMNKEGESCDLATYDGQSDYKISDLRAKLTDRKLAKDNDSENGQRKDCDERSRPTTSNAVNTSTDRHDSVAKPHNPLTDMAKSNRQAYSTKEGKTRTISTDYKSLLGDRSKEMYTKDITDLEQFG